MTIGALLASVSLNGIAHATALIAVNTTADEDGTGSSCSLREAIKSANTDTAYGGCYKGSGDDLIYFVTSGQTVTLTKSASLSITGGLTIEGYDTTIRGGTKGGFSIETASNVTIRGLKLTAFTNHPAFNVYGSLNLSKVDIYDNISGSTSQTMSIWLRSTGYVVATDVALRNNHGIKGGGVYNNGGRLTIINSTIANNRSSQYGGGIMTTGATGVTEIINCTISGNRADDYFGGGVYNGNNSETEIYNSTIYGNNARLGGGIWKDDSYVYASIAIRNTIVANNTASEGNAGCKGMVFSYSGNLIGTNSCPLTPMQQPTSHAPDQTNVSDVRLGALARVGSGIQWAHTPLSGSPALDKITASPNYCYRTYDQINTTRPRNTKCDVGSIEK